MHITALSLFRTALFNPVKEDFMVQLELTEDDRLILLQVLESCISDLRVEIAGTDNFNYKDMLKQRKEILIKLERALISDKQTQAMT